MIGNDGTLLPEGPSETGAPFHVWSCWETPPEGFDAMLERVAAQMFEDPAALRAELLCGHRPRRPVGTPLALDAPRPPGHPLGPD